MFTGGSDRIFQEKQILVFNLLRLLGPFETIRIVLNYLNFCKVEYYRILISSQFFKLLELVWLSGLFVFINSIIRI